MLFKKNTSIVNSKVPADHGYLAIAPFFPGYDFGDQPPFVWEAPG
jgi:hypothetical protein